MALSFALDTTLQDGRLYKNEIFWADHQAWLNSKGYSLRGRYQPGWVASWLGLNDPDLRIHNYEDAQTPKHGDILDATRLSDGKCLLLKRIKVNYYPDEVKIARTFSSEPLSSHPNNHCIPIYDVLNSPNEAQTDILVMPFLLLFFQIPLYTYGEAMDFFDQLFRGLQFMHANRYAHGDVKLDNILMDGLHLYKERPHPFKLTRTRDLKKRSQATQRTKRPVKYYYIDFGLTRQFPPSVTKPLVEPGPTGDKSVPEYRTSRMVDPFAVDVYCLGNLIREHFLTGWGIMVKPKVGFEFIQELIDSMVQADPEKRPTMDEVVARFEQIKRGLSWWKLRSRISEVDEKFSDTVYLSIRHFWRTLGYIITLKPAIPTPK